MQPWKISVGFTVIIIAIAGMIGGEHFAFVEPHFQIIFTDYWVALAWYGGAAMVSVMAVIYASARALGLGRSRPQGRSHGALYSARRRKRTKPNLPTSWHKSNAGGSPDKLNKGEL